MNEKPRRRAKRLRGAVFLPEIRKAAEKVIFYQILLTMCTFGYIIYAK